MLQLTGTTQAEAFRSVIPGSGTPAALVDRLVELGRGWQGARQDLSGGMVEGIGPDGRPQLMPSGASSYTYPATVQGFTSFMGSFVFAAMELGISGPLDQSAIATQVARRLIGTNYDGSKSLTQNLIDAGFLGRPGQTISVVRTDPTPAAGGPAAVREVLATYGSGAPQVGDIVQVGARRVPPPPPEPTAVPFAGTGAAPVLKLAPTVPTPLGGGGPSAPALTAGGDGAAAAAGEGGGGLAGLPVWVWLALPVAAWAVLRRDRG